MFNTRLWVRTASVETQASKSRGKFLKGFGNRNQAVSLTLHGSFSHVPQTEVGTYKGERFGGVQARSLTFSSSNNRAPQSVHTSVGASSIIVTACMVRVAAFPPQASRRHCSQT